MKNNTIRKEQFENHKFIFPRGEWVCYVCLKPKRNMEIVEIDADAVCLVCVVCRQDLNKEFRLQEAIKN